MGIFVHRRSKTIDKNEVHPAVIFSFNFTTLCLQVEYMFNGLILIRDILCIFFCNFANKVIATVLWFCCEGEKELVFSFNTDDNINVNVSMSLRLLFHYIILFFLILQWSVVKMKLITMQSFVSEPNKTIFSVSWYAIRNNDTACEYNIPSNR